MRSDVLPVGPWEHFLHRRGSVSGAVWQRSKPDSIRFALLHPHICSSSRSQLDQRQAYARRERAGRIQGAAGAPDLPTPLEPMEPLQSLPTIFNREWRRGSGKGEGRRRMRQKEGRRKENEPPLILHPSFATAPLCTKESRNSDLRACLWGLGI